MGMYRWVGVAAVAMMAGAPALATVTTVAPIASFSQATGKKNANAKILYYKNEDTSKTTTTVTKTPIYTTVYTPVYTVKQTPIYNSKGVITGYKTTQVQTGTTATQKITGYNTVTTKSTKITPKAEIYTTNGSNTTAAAAPVSFSYLSPISSGFSSRLSGPLNALFSMDAIATTTPTVTGGSLTQLLDSGTISFKLATPIYRLDALGHNIGPALSNLLTVTFKNAELIGTASGTTISLGGSSILNPVSFTSDFRTFDLPNSEYDFSITGVAASNALSVAAIDPSLTNVTGGHTFNSFRVATVGLFSASVPEPASWGMMVLGFGLMGAGLRGARRQRLSFAA
jgi:hypothetical protein